MANRYYVERGTLAWYDQEAEKLAREIACRQEDLAALLVERGELYARKCTRVREARAS
jgi:hypothetical protein